MSTKWSVEQIAAQYRLEVRERFEAENAEAERQDAIELAQMQAEYAAQGQAMPSHLSEPFDGSVYWLIYQDTNIQIARGAVAVTTPHRAALYVDMIQMFSDVSVCRSMPFVKAEIIAGHAHVVIDLRLVDSWDDVQHATWLVKRVQHSSHE